MKSLARLLFFSRHKKSFVFSAIYLTLVICMSELSLLIQMIILNVYHVDPVPPVPRWLKWITGTQNAVAPDHDNDGELNSVPSMRRYDKAESKLSAESCAVDSMQNECSNILRLLEKLVQIGKSGYGCESEEHLRAEWQLAARNRDKFFFVLFLSINLIVSLTFTIIMYSLDDA